MNSTSKAIIISIIAFCAGLITASALDEEYFMHHCQSGKSFQFGANISVQSCEVTLP